MPNPFSGAPARRPRARRRPRVRRRPGRRAGLAGRTSAPPSPSSVLAGSTATNTGPSVLNGDLGVSPGTALVGFGLPAVVNGATHATDAVAAQAQLDLTTAYDVAAGQPVSPANDLTGTDLGNRDPEGRRLPLHLVGPAHRPADARRRGRSRTRSSCSRSARR